LKFIKGSVRCGSSNLKAETPRGTTALLPRKGLMVAGGCTEPVRLWLDRPAGNVYHRSCEALGYRPFATNGSACAFSKALSQVTANVFERVLNVRVNAGTDHEGTATAFTIDVDGREYLITAKNVVQGLRDCDKIDVFMNDPWAPLDVKIFRCADPIDIAVRACVFGFMYPRFLSPTAGLQIFQAIALALGRSPCPSLDKVGVLWCSGRVVSRSQVSVCGTGSLHHPDLCLNSSLSSIKYNRMGQAPAMLEA
jgi:hypothetical protein